MRKPLLNHDEQGFSGDQCRRVATTTIKAIIKTMTISQALISISSPPQHSHSINSRVLMEPRTEENYSSALELLLGSKVDILPKMRRLVMRTPVNILAVSKYSGEHH
jgi:hypothetical protein